MSSSPRNVAILGSTGSIGKSTLEVIESSQGKLAAIGLSAHSRVSELAAQAVRYKPRWVVATEPDIAAQADWTAVDSSTKLLQGADAIQEMVSADEVDVVVAAIVGSAGLSGTWAAVEAGKTVALANKETLVMAGPLVMKLAAQRGATILPIDSEHSAVFQAMQAGRRGEIRRVILTASGGPFRQHTPAELASVTVKQALNHPTWDMGPKITIDSATMMNKALEIIEARWLFGIEAEKIDVVVHPQSIVHSMVEFNDGSVIAQLSPPDMKLPIQYALSYPERWHGPAAKLDLTTPMSLEFEPPDIEKFPALELGHEVARMGGTAGAVLNAANEAAVAQFLDGQIGFAEIVPACKAVLENHDFDPQPTLPELIRIDVWGAGGGKQVDLHLIADLAGILSTLSSIGLVAIGLGMVIFVHELGHFLVAKACGVKCEKFYVGFDVPINLGLIRIPGSLFKFQWGETEYGIGAIPLGGYVKMLGQDDNPANAEAEAERTRVRHKSADEPAAEEPSADAPEGQSPGHASDQASDRASAAAKNHPADSAADEEEFVVDPRSYTAKNVPQRMCIISAGVIMNLIFAVIFGAVGYRMGVKYLPCVAGDIGPGSPAWMAGIQPSDKLIRIGDLESEHLRFRKDLQTKVLLNRDKPLKIGVRRGDETFTVTVTPQKVGEGFFAIGLSNQTTLEIGEVALHSSAGMEDFNAQHGDVVKSVNGQEIVSRDDWNRYVALHPNDELEVVIERKVPQEDPKAEPIVENHTVKFAPNPTATFGAAMEMGPIVGVRPGSIAEQAGLKAGDVIESLNGETIGDPLYLELKLLPLAGQEVALGIQRDGQPVEIKLTPETPGVSSRAFATPYSHVGAESIGIAYDVIPTVVSVQPDSPAANADLQPGDKITQISISSDVEELKEKYESYFGKPTELGEAQGIYWQHAMLQIEGFNPADLKVTLSVERDGKVKEKVLTPFPSEQWNRQDRGIGFVPISDVHTAASWSEAFFLGYRETKDRFFEVLTVLKQLLTRKLSPTNLGGPVGILAYAGSEASVSVSRLLLFLTFLSANLAIVNFLPIPALDGGHMVFLTYEAIVGKPVNEQIQMYLTAGGVMFLLTLIVCVTFFDVSRLLNVFM